MKKILLAASLLVASLGAQAETKYMVAGPGSIDCFKYLDAPTDSELDRMFISWAQGFFTYRLLSSELGLTRSEMSVDFLKRNINRYCEANPTEDFYFAVISHINIVEGIAKSDL